MFERRNIKENYIKVLKVIKNFLLNTKSREFLFFLFFFFIAGAFWLLQMLNDEYETNLSIPVKLVNVPDNVVITSGPPTTIQVKVRDKGTVLLNYMLSRNFSPVNLDFNNYSGGGNSNYIRIYASEYEKWIQSQLNTSTRLLSISPDTLEYIYSTGKSKQIPIKLVGKISAERQYYISDTLYDPDSVLVYAPGIILDTINAAYTEFLSLENISDTVVHTALISPVKGAKFIPNAVMLKFPVDIYTEKTVEVPVYGINFPNDKILRSFPPKVNVTFQIGLSNFKDITADNFAITIPFSELSLLTTDKYTVRLTNAPPGIRNIRISPPQIDFLIEQVSANDD